MTCSKYVLFVAVPVLWACLAIAANPDPCAKLVLQAQKSGKRADIEKLQACRRNQKPSTAPWMKDGGTDDEYVRVPCPEGFPKWRVCEKRRSELADGGMPDAGH